MYACSGSFAYRVSNARTSSGVGGNPVSTIDTRRIRSCAEAGSFAGTPVLAKRAFKNASTGFPSPCGTFGRLIG